MEDYKEKYKKVLERAKAVKETYLNLDNISAAIVLESIFPELKESEDERIRKAIIAYMRYERKSTEEEIESRFIPWLEKQCEQKPTDKIEPKFKVGDWVTNGIDFTFKVMSIKDDMYYRDDNYFIDIKTADKTFRLWTIQDAKDGDVLVASDGSIFIFKETEDCGCKHYIAIEKDSKTINVNDNLEHFWESIRGVKPSTKKQRDIFFQKMHEAGYKWDAEKKDYMKGE